MYNYSTSIKFIFNKRKEGKCLYMQLFFVASDCFLFSFCLRKMIQEEYTEITGTTFSHTYKLTVSELLHSGNGLEYLTASQTLHYTEGRRILPPFNNTRQVGMKTAQKWRALNLQSVPNEVGAFVIGFLARSYVNHVQSLPFLGKYPFSRLFRRCNIR